MMQTIAQINNVTYRYKGASDNSLDGVSLTIQKGEMLLLCGASGSGKTSVIRLLNGLIPHYYHGDMTGNVTVHRLDINKTQLYELAGVVGTVFQNPRSQFFSVDTDGEIVFGPENIGLDPKEINARKEIIAKQMKLDKLLGRSLFELSGGEKQRIACASVAALLPEIILLDEPSSNLDMEAIHMLHEIICDWKRQGKTIIISEHRLWYLNDLVDRVVYMDKGRIAHEWKAKDFAMLSNDETKQLGLRPTSINLNCLELLADQGHTACSQEYISDGILLKDFYFSYYHKPYILRRKKFSASDGDALSLCIPELAIPKGKVTAVIGSNGTGKSTFLRCICGLERDCTGVIVSDGKEYRKKQRLGFSYMVMQDVNHQLFTDSVEKEILLSMRDKDEKRCHEILDVLGLRRYKDAHPMALSGGQKQRVAIASAIAAGEELLLFDEPTSGLDYAHMERVGKLLRQLAETGRTVLVSTHDPEFIEQCCDYKLRIEKGRLFSFE